MWMVMGTFIYGLGLTWVFISLFGLYGAAYGLVTAVFITVTVKQIMLQRYLPINPWQPFVQSLLFYPELVLLLRNKIKS